jgi:3'(2'), 5'-bisphosphate nucleotidase
MNTQDLVVAVNAISKVAGAAILEVYHRKGGITVSHKSDDSPLTEADLGAHKIIEASLQALTPDLPILSEESDDISWEERNSWETYWLVDPLDGTKEFVNRNGEFTVNIALIDKGVPVLGVVYVPVLDILYSGTIAGGAFKEEGGVTAEIKTLKASENNTLKVVASRSHRGELLDQWIAQAEDKFSGVELVSMGSSLKICLVAEGKADIYPRLALTSEWDTGAAQAILEAAGGTLKDVNHNVYRYNQKENILNPFFFAIGDKAYPWQDIVLK